jgi:hypothetical protein
LGVYLFPFTSATKLHFFLGVFLHFITGDDTNGSTGFQTPVFCPENPASQSLTLSAPKSIKFVALATGVKTAEKRMTAQKRNDIIRLQIFITKLLKGKM